MYQPMPKMEPDGSNFLEVAEAAQAAYPDAEFFGINADGYMVPVTVNVTVSEVE